MTSDDIRKVTFEKAVRGYRPEDVDDFLLQVAKEVDALTAELDEALAAKEEAENKLYILAEKVEEYRGQEETLKTALINAQRMGETVVHEAKQKAESMVREATGKAELLRQKAEHETLAEQDALEKMQTEVTRFKATILNLYKQHIESLSALDAPVEHVAEFLEENGRYEEQPEEQQAAAEEGYYAENAYEETDEQPTTTVAAPAPAQLPAEEEQAMPQRSAMDLFEGVPIDSDL